MKWTKHIPNALTLLNLLLGCLAVVYIFHDNNVFRAFSTTGAEYTFLIDFSGFPERFQLTEVHYGKLHIAAILVFVCAIIDFVDGFIARLLNAQSAVGKELDSLADVVSFGVVPGLIAFELLKMSFFKSPAAFGYGLFLFVPAFAVTLGAALRLAKFNVDTTQTKTFKGLPTPAMAITLAALALALFFNELNSYNWLLNIWIIYAVVAVLTYLMLSPHRLLNIKFSPIMSENKPRFIFLGMAAVIFLIGWLALDAPFMMVPVIILVYIVYSIIVNRNKDDFQSRDQRDALEGTP